MQKIPQADLSAFLSNDTSLQNEFVQKIGNSFEEIGFLALKGHFLDSDLQASLYDEINAFFALPLEIKSQYEIEGGEDREAIPVLEKNTRKEEVLET